MKAFARLVGPVPGHDHPIELHNLLLEADQLIAERGKTRTGNLWHPFVARVGNNMQQFRDPFTPDRRDNAELGEVRSDRIHHRGLLADKQMACAVKHIRQLCCSGVLVGTNRMVAVVTASQIVSASAISFFCRLT
ncbi:MAG: hypothetical protein QOJ58_3843 [Alphaproteobacteria bacterium]|nr:hypothetical protein [Alphaproteobacteria bacterium]